MVGVLRMLCTLGMLCMHYVCMYAYIYVVCVCFVCMYVGYLSYVDVFMVCKKGYDMLCGYMLRFASYV